MAVQRKRRNSRAPIQKPITTLGPDHNQPQPCAREVPRRRLPRALAQREIASWIDARLLFHFWLDSAALRTCKNHSRQPHLSPHSCYRRRLLAVRLRTGFSTFEADSHRVTTMARARCCAFRLAPLLSISAATTGPYPAYGLRQLLRHVRMVVLFHDDCG